MNLKFVDDIYVSMFRNLSEDGQVDFFFFFFFFLFSL